MARVQDCRFVDHTQMIEVKVGDSVSFKSDIEQTGKIVKIKGNELYLENENGFSGEYIGGQMGTYEFASDCWVE